MPTVEHQGLRIHFDDLGSGPAMVLGHSFLCSGEMWAPQISRLAEARQVVNVDYRGHGRSGRVERPFTLYDLVDEVVAVLDHLQIERAVWAGLSIGGMVALRAALTAPERVSGLILLDSHAGAEGLWKKLKYRAMGWGARLVGFRPFLPAVLPLMFGRTTLGVNRTLVETWKEKFAAMDLPSMFHALEALVRRDSVVARLGEIRVPALVLVGEEDRSLPVADAEEIHAGLPDSRLVVIPKAGHLSTLEQPQAVTEAMLEFLDGLLPGPGTLALGPVQIETAGDREQR